MTIGKITNANFSTSEVATGQLWVDGRPIYRKVMTASETFTTGYVNFPHGITGLDVITKYNGYITRANGEKQFIPRLPVASNIMSEWLFTLHKWDTTNITIYVGTLLVDAESVTGGAFIIEYVKTT